MLKVTNPSTGKLISELTTDDGVSVSKKFADAKAAQQTWQRVPVAERIKIIQRFGQLLSEQRDVCAKILTAEVGKPIQQSRNELNKTQLRIKFFVENVEKVIADRVVGNDAAMREMISFEPLGVVANISAWNYPYFVGSNVFLPALLTGNAVLYKPSELASLTGLKIAELFTQAELPKNLFQTIIGPGSVGDTLLNCPIDGVFFTGSYRTGSAIAAKVAPRLIKMQLELGGKDPIYVCDDVDASSAAEGIMDGAFYNAGQSCCSVERVYVQKKLAQSFIEASVQFATNAVVGDPTDESTYVGPLARREQITVLLDQVLDAVKKGARVLCGGGPVKGRDGWFEPTVLVDVTHQMKIMREESFGPVIGIQVVDSDEDAVRLMNDTEYGLTAGVYTRDEVRARQILRDVNAGTAYWNCCDRVNAPLPWSGRGHSGIGTTLGEMGIEAFVRPKAWHLRAP